MQNNMQNSDWPLHHLVYNESEIPIFGCIVQKNGRPLNVTLQQYYDATRPLNFIWGLGEFPEGANIIDLIDVRPGERVLSVDMQPKREVQVTVLDERTNIQKTYILLRKSGTGRFEPGYDNCKSARMEPLPASKRPKR